MEAYKVGVTFALKNLISPELAKILEQLQVVNRAAMGLAENLGKAFGGASAELKGMATSAAEATAAMERMAIVGREAAVASSSSFGKNFSKGAGLGFFLKPGPMIAGYLGYESLRHGAAMDDTIVRAMVAMGMGVDAHYGGTDAAKKIRSAIFGATTSFGLDQGDVEAAALQAVRTTAPLSADQRLALLPSILNFAGAEVRGKAGTTAEEATEAAISLAHQMRAYTPQQIEPLLNQFAKLSMASPDSLTRMTRMMSYYLPLLNTGLGVDAGQLMALGAVGSQMGLGTKSGTWLAQLFQAPFVADLTGSRGAKRRHALEELGIVEDGHVTTKDPAKFFALIAGAASRLSKQELMRDFVAGFGQQGARAAALFSDDRVRNNVLQLSKGLYGANTPAQLAAAYSNSPEVQAAKAQAQYNEALTNFATQVMPAVSAALNAMAKAFEWLNDLKAWSEKDKTDDFRAWATRNFGWLKHHGDAVPPPAANNGNITIPVNIDGKKVAQIVTDHQGMQLQGVATMQSTGQSFDPSLTLAPAGF